MVFISKIRFIRYTFDCHVKKYSIYLSASQMLERHLRADRENSPVTLFLLGFFLQFASSFQLLVRGTFDSCGKWRLRYICDLHIIHHYLYKKCTCFCNKVHHKRKTKPFIDRFITAVILVVIAVQQLCKFQFN